MKKLYQIPTLLRSIKSKHICTFGLVLVVTSLFSCSWLLPTPKPVGFFQKPIMAKTYPLQPNSLAPVLVNILESPPLQKTILRTYDGKIETDYEEYNGDEEGLLWWKKKYQERSKYVFSLQSKWWSDPNQTVLSIFVETQQRINEHYKWGSYGSIRGQKRAITIFKSVDSQLMRITKQFPYERK